MPMVAFQQGWLECPSQCGVHTRWLQVPARRAGVGVAPQSPGPTPGGAALHSRVCQQKSFAGWAVGPTEARWVSTSLRFTRLALSASLRDRHETLPQGQQPLGMAAELANLKFEVYVTVTRSRTCRLHGPAGYTDQPDSATGTQWAAPASSYVATESALALRLDRGVGVSPG